MSNDLMMETIQCLTKTFTTADKTERLQAEERLKQLENDLMTHFKLLLEALKNESLLAKELKISLILYLRKIVKDKITEKKLSKEYAIEILKYYVEVILTNTLSDVCLQNVTHSLQDLLNFKLVSESKQIVSELVELLHNYLRNTVGGNVPVYRSIVHLIDNIMLSSSVSQTNAIDILKTLLSSAEYMLGHLSTAIMSPELKSNLNVYLSYIEISKLIFNFLYSSVTKMRSRLNIFTKVSHLYSEIFIEMACHFILQPVPNINEVQYISFQGISEIDNAINQMKAKIFQFANSIISSYGSRLENQRLVTAYSSVIKAVVESLDEVVLKRFGYLQEMTKDSTTYPDYNYSNVLYQMILFMGRIIVKTPFLENFAEFSKNFAKSIIIPLLIGTKSEISQMKENGEEYCNYISDVIDDHKNKTIKSVTAFLLQNMSEKFDGFGTFVVNYCVQIADFVIKGSMESLPQYYLLNSEDRIFKLADSEFQIETCFLIFSIQTSYVFKVKSLKDNLKNLFETHFQALLGVNSDLIKNRLCLFLGIYIDNIYEPEDIHFAYCVEYLFINLFYYKENRGVAHQAADSLNDLVGVKKFTNALREIIGKHLPTIIENIKDIKIGLYFDVLLEIVINIDIEAYLIPMMSELTKRVLVEIAPYTRIKFRVQNEDGSTSSSRREKNPQYNIVVNKCFNIIRTVAENSNYVNKYILNLEEILEPIFDHMKNPSKIDFDEDIVLIFTSFIKHLKTIPQSALKVLPHLPKYLKKCNGLLLDLYELVNQFVVYGRGIIDTKDDYSKIIMKIFRASFDKNCDYDKSPFLGAILMQVWVQNSAEIPLNLVKEIMLIAIDQIKSILSSYKDLEDFEDSPDVYNFIALIVLVYSGFINYPFPTFEAVITNNDSNNFIIWSEQLIKLGFYSTYLAKSLIIGICSFLRNETLIKQVPEQIHKFLQFLLFLLNKQKNEESKYLKTVLKKEIQCNFIDSDEEDEDDESDEENEEINSKIMNINKLLSKDMEKIYKKFNMDEYNGYSNEREIKDICERTLNPVKELDEYEFFKQSVEFLNKIDNTFWGSWVNTLSDKDKMNLDTLIHTRRVTINHSSVSGSYPRKIVKIRKPENQDNN